MLAPRPYLIEEYTQTVCPRCFENGPRRSDEEIWRAGMLVSRDEKVWMHRFCAEHGETQSLYEEDLALWPARASERPVAFAGLSLVQLLCLGASTYAAIALFGSFSRPRAALSLP